MSGLPNNAFTSPNFTFLTKYDEVLVRHAALAERYVFDDQNSALPKLRQFGELLAQHTAAYTGVAVEEHDSQPPAAAGRNRPGPRSRHWWFLDHG
jgi:hypothetical protein